MYGENFINTSLGSESGTMNIRITNIQIMLNTNIPGMTPTPLQFNMLYHPDLEKGRYSAKQYNLPFFTDSVKYPMDILAAKTYSDRVDFFFNKTRFNKICRKSGTDYIQTDQPTDTLNEDDVVQKTPDQIKQEEAQQAKEKESEIEILKKEQSNADHNVRCMLVLLLPIADEFHNVFQTSYDQYILNKPSSEIYTLRNIDPFVLLNPTWIPLYNYFRPRQYFAPIQEISYLKKGEMKYAITSVVWMNDLVNNPVYRDFVSVFHDKMRETFNSRKKILKQLKERLDVFKSVLLKYNTPPAKTSSVGNTSYKDMLDILIHNVPNYDKPDEGVMPIPLKNDLIEIEIIINNLVIASRPNFSQKDNTKRETIQRICKYLLKIHHDLNLSPPVAKPSDISNKTAFEHANSIVNAYIEFTNYNEGSDKDMKITLKDSARILTALYNDAIYVKTAKLVQEFVFKAVRLDVFEKNLDGSDKPKMDLDIIRTMRKYFPYYVSLSDDIFGQLRGVIEPARRSSNYELQDYLKTMFRATQASDEDVKDRLALIEIYNKYIANTQSVISDNVVNKYMYTGVSTIVSGTSANTSDNDKDKNQNKDKPDSAKEIPEIHVYVNVIQKDEYEKSLSRDCIMSDDALANHLKQLLYTNTMIDNSFPEVNPYRSFQFLEGSREKTLLDNGESTDALKKSNSTDTATRNTMEPTPTKIGGSKTYKRYPKTRIGRSTRRHSSR